MTPYDHAWSAVKKFAHTPGVDAILIIIPSTKPVNARMYVYAADSVPGPDREGIVNARRQSR